MFITVGVILFAFLVAVVVLICKKFKKVKKDYERLLIDAPPSDVVPTGGLREAG